jgi:hypothetical protein
MPSALAGSAGNRCVFSRDLTTLFADVLRQPGRERAWWLNSVASKAQTMNDVSITDGDRGDIPLGSLALPAQRRRRSDAAIIIDILRGRLGTEI